MGQYPSHIDNTSLKESPQEEFSPCIICLEQVTKTRALPCSHSFCLGCLTDYVCLNPANQPGYFPCPTCDEDTMVPPGGVDMFPENFVPLSLADAIEVPLNNNSKNNSQHEPSPPLCLNAPSPQEQRIEEDNWYFGEMSRNASEKWLLASDYPAGTFMVRKMETNSVTEISNMRKYVLSVRDCDKLRGYVVRHYKILTHHNPETCKDCYFITSSRVFSSLDDLVNHHKERVDGLCCKLVSKSDKPSSPLIWSTERGKDEYHTSKDTVNMVRRLGSGQFAEVWLAKLQGSSNVAVKINLDCVTTAAFLDEAQILKTLQHPNIIELRGICSDSEPVYLLLEYMPKGQLSRYLRRAGSTLEVSQLVYIGAQAKQVERFSNPSRMAFAYRNQRSARPKFTTLYGRVGMLTTLTCDRPLTS